MNKKTYFILASFALCPSTVHAFQRDQTPHPFFREIAHAGSSERAKVAQAIAYQFSHETKMNAKAGSVKIESLDIQGAWAYATVHPLITNKDNAKVVLHKRRSGWKVIMLGTEMQGTGRKLGVPRRLWDVWGLGIPK